MKKLLIFLAVVMAVSILPAAALADGPHDRQDRYQPNGHHDQAWQDKHDRAWKEHEEEWADHDREWKDHRGDRQWRKEHSREWRDWYQWHRDNEKGKHFHLSLDDFELDIDI
jgi:hypothetical protein